MENSTKVFLSSTAKDLQPYRDAVFEVICKLEGHTCVRREDFGAVDGEPIAICRRKVAECDVLVGLIGHLRGSRPVGSDSSYTELEIEEARKGGKVCLMFVAAEDFSLPVNLREPEGEWQRQRAFRERVLREQVAVSFREPEELATMVATALQNQWAAKRALGEGQGWNSSSTKTTMAPSEIERAYLDQLVDRYRYLDFRGMGILDRLPLRLPLRDMYVPLTARVRTAEGETWAGRPIGDEELSERRPVLDLLRQNPGLVLLGHPGSGKTTFLKLLGLEIAAGHGEALGFGSRTPVLVPLSAYANALAKGEVSLRRFLPQYFEDRGLDLPLSGFLEAKLADGELLLLLDGLDEVRELEWKNLVVERVKDFYSRHRRAGNKFVLTSRVVGYQEVRPAAEGLVEATLVDFDDAEIEGFVKRWTSAIEKAAVGDTGVAREGAERETDELLAVVRSNPGVRSLAANPLLLTILALMKRQGVTLPERRVELYQRYVEALVKHWNLARSVAGRSSKGLDLLDTIRILQPVALWMHENSPGVGLVKEWDLHRELGRLFGERGERDSEREALRFLEDVRDHTSLLLDRGGRQYGFIHLILQQYLAAAAVAQRGQQDVTPVVETLVAHIGEAAWQEVSLLTLSYMALVQQRDEAAGAVLEQLLLQATDRQSEAALLAGQAVVDIGRTGLPAGCREKVVTSLLVALRNDSEVEARRRAAAGAVLAAAGDPRAEVMTIDGMEFCWVQAGSFLMGTESEQKGVRDDERPQEVCSIPHSFLIGRYPVSLAQYLEISSENAETSDSSRSKGRVNEPVVRVSWYEAAIFCERLTARWRTARRLEPGWVVRLPTEAEWEKAARGGQSVPAQPLIVRAGEWPQAVSVLENPVPRRIYPWGDWAEPNRGNYLYDSCIGSPSAIGCFPGSASPYGCEEMSGSVWEWTTSLWGEDIMKTSFKYPYVGSDGREDAQAPAQVLRVARGGAFSSSARNIRCAFRSRYHPDFRDILIGSRVVLGPAYAALAPL